MGPFSFFNEVCLKITAYSEWWDKLQVERLRKMIEILACSAAAVVLIAIVSGFWGLFVSYKWRNKAESLQKEMDAHKGTIEAQKQTIAVYEEMAGTKKNVLLSVVEGGKTAKNS